jgi:hypothetical protein
MASKVEVKFPGLPRSQKQIEKPGRKNTLGERHFNENRN